MLIVKMVGGLALVDDSLMFDVGGWWGQRGSRLPEVIGGLRCNLCRPGNAPTSSDVTRNLTHHAEDTW